MKQLLVAACALIDERGKVLLARRPPGRPMAGLWEFPGGKVQAGETPEQAMIRELHEELGIRVAPACLEALTFVSHAYEDFHLLMPFYTCRRWAERVRAMEGQTLAWVAPLDMAEWPLLSANAPLVVRLQGFLKEQTEYGKSG